MASAAQVFQDIGSVKPAGEPGSGNQFPKLPPDGRYKLEITHCELLGDEQQDCGVCMVIEHKVLESSTPLAVVGQMYVTTITHLTGEYKDMKQGKVRNLIASAFRVGEDDATQPWAELAVYVATKDAAKGKIVRAETSLHRSKNKGRQYMQVRFSQA